MAKFKILTYAYIESEVEAEDEHEALKLHDEHFPDFDAFGNATVKILDCGVSEAMGCEVFDEDGNEVLNSDWN